MDSINPSVPPSRMFFHSKRLLSVSMGVTLLVTQLPPPPVFASQVAADSLVGYWKLDETSGTTAADSSGDGKTGTHQSSPTISSTVPTLSFTNVRSLQFAGSPTKNYVSTALSFPATAGSMSAWVYPTSYNDWVAPVAWKLSGATNGYILLDEGGSGSPGRWRAVFRPDNSGNAEANIVASATITQNSWTHLAMTWNKSGGVYTFTLYVNGTSQGSNTWTGSVGSSGVGNFNIGRGGDVDDNYYIGNVDDVRVYSHTLAPWEVSDLASGNHPRAFWKGTNSTGLENAGNWSGSYVPDPYSRIVIQPRANQLTLTGSIQVAGLTINTGATLKTNAFGLTMLDSGTFTNYGTFIIKGTETFSGLTNDYSKGTVLVYGTGSYTGLPTGSSYYNLTLNDGLMAYWKMDETNGVRAADSSGYGNSGTLLNSPTISSAVAPTNFTNKRSLGLNGSTQCVGIPGNIIPASTNAFTVSAWVKATSVSGGGAIFYKDATYGEAYLGLYDLEGGSTVSKWVSTVKLTNGNWYSAVPAENAVTGQWYHVAMVYRKNASVQTYVNGSLRASRALPSGNNLYVTPGFVSSIGCYNNSGLYFNGQIDDVRYYNTALSTGALAALAAGNEPSTGLATVTLNALTTINGDLTLNGGTLDTSTSSYGLIIGKNWLNNGGKFLPRSSNVTFTGTTSGLEILSGGQSFAKMTFNGSGGTWNTRDRMTASGTTVITAGTLDASGSYAMRFGQLSQIGGTIVPRSGMITLTNHNYTNTITSTLNSLHFEDPLENGLVGYWKLDEGTNSGAIIDSTILNPVGVRRGTGAIWTSSVPSAITFDNPFAMQFNGAPGDAVSIPVTSSFPSNPSTITQSLWMKTTTGCGQLVLVTRRNQALSLNSDWATLFVLNGSVYFNLDDKSYGHSTAGVRVDDGVWHHIAGVKNGTTYSLYVDGTFRDSFTDAHSMDGASGLNYNIGLGPNWVGTNFIGSIDDVRVYNRALSANEIMNLARGNYANGASAGTFTPGSNISANTLSLDAGNISLGSANLTIANDFTLSRGNGTLTGGISYLSFGGNVTLSGSTITGNSSTFNIDGNLRMYTGSLVAPGYVYLNGNLFTSGGRLDVTNFILDGGNQTLTGSLAFYNLTKTVTSPYTLSIASGYPVTVTGALVLKGAAANLLSLRSTSPGVAATFRLASIGTQDIQYGDIADSDATGGVTLQCLTSNGCLNSGNNTNWFFGTTTVTTAPAETTATHTPSGGGRGHGTTLQRAITVRTALIQNFEQQIAANTSVNAKSGTTSSTRSQRPVIAQGRSSVQSQRPAIITQGTSSKPEKGIQIAQERGKLLVAMTDRNVLYKDVPVDQWFAPYVSQLITDGIAQGYKTTEGVLTGEFGVANNVTRAEMLKMALEAAGKKPGSEQPPRNLSAKGSWASPYVGLAEKMQLSVFGVTTDINSPASRGEVVQTILEVMGITIGNTPADYTDIPKNYRYSNAIASATFFGVVQGDTNKDGYPTGTFRPEDPINRAEVAKMIALAAKLLK